MDDIARIQARSKRFMASVDGIFRQLILWYPSCWEGFIELNNIIFQEEKAMWGGVNQPAMSESQRQAESNQAHADCQMWCDRIASLIRGISLLAQQSFPELGQEFSALSDKATDLLTDYRERLGTNEIVELALRGE